MLLKFKCNDTNSKTVHEWTFVNEETTVNSFLISKKLENDFLEVLSGESFTNVVLLDNDVEVLKWIKFDHLQNTIRCGTLDLKVVVR